MLKMFKGVTSMKRLLLILCGAILLSCFSPSPSVRAQAPQGATVEHQEKHHWWNFHKNKVHKEKVKKEKHHKDGQQQSAQQQSAGGHLYNFPKSLGWWHKGPGPAGAGVN
jgi:hypothetical protein